MLALSDTHDAATSNANAIVDTTSYAERQLAMHQRFCVLQTTYSLCKARRGARRTS